MKTPRILALLCVLAFSAPAAAQSIGGAASLSVTSITGSVQLPASTSTYPFAMITFPPGAAGTEVFYALGGSSVAATTSSPSLPAGGLCINVGPNGYLAAITAASTATLRITQFAACPLR